MRLPESDGLVVKESTFVKDELGVITRRGYKKGELLFKVEGPIQPRPTKYSFAIALDQHIEPQREDGVSDFGHYLNHSCDPNVIVRPVAKGLDTAHIDVIARRALDAGEEVAFDYASLEYEVTITNAVCKCNSAQCRKIIQGFKDLPRHIAEQYEHEGLIPAYLLLAIGSQA
jgi:hypothetical protein